MKLDPYLGEVVVEVAWATGPDDPAPAWVDITDFVVASAGVVMVRGRDDEYAAVQPSRLNFTVDNTLGYFTPGYPGSPWFPGVKYRRKVRASAVVGGVTYRRFTGWFDELPVEWPGGGDYCEAQVSASGRFARLGTSRALRSAIEEEIVSDSPVAYYTLGEASGAVAAGDTSGAGAPPLTVTQVGAGGTADFGSGTGPGTDGLTALILTPASNTAGKYLSAVPSAPITSTAFTVEAFINTTLVNPFDEGVARISGPGGAHIALGVDWGYLTAECVTSAGAVAYGLSSAGLVANGATHHVALTYSETAGVTTMHLYLDGVDLGVSSGAAPPGFVASLLVAGKDWKAAGLYAGTLSHVAYYAAELTAARIAAHAAAGLTGFAGERTDQRVARIARYANIPTGELALEAGMTVAMSAATLSGAAPLQAMQDAAATEGGILYGDGAGLLTFQARSHRYNQPVAATIAAEDTDGGARFVVNAAQLVNDVTATRANGVTVRAVNAQSIADYDPARVDAPLLVTSDAELTDAANWRANQTADITPRIPNLTVDILTHPALAAAVLALDISSRITVTGLPATAPAASADLFVEGITETISDAGWLVTLNTSPAGGSQVWQLDSAQYSVLGVTSRLAY